MKYSITFLYSLLLKEGYIVADIKKHKNIYEITVTHPIKNAEWVIKLDEEIEDKVQNVLYQIQSPIDSSIQIGQCGKLGPIVVHGFKHVNK